MSLRVRIGTCSGPADAALTRSMFSAHGIDVVIGAENHAGMLAGLGGSFLSLDIWVDDEDSEEAAALLRDLRERNDGAEVPDENDDDEYDGDETGESWRESATASVARRTDQRSRTARALLLGCIITFGTAHMFAGAWRRGLALAGVEIVGFLELGAGHRIGAVAVLAAILCDLSGATWRLRVARRTALPMARLRG